jgi:hypothetical protein
MVCIPFKGYSVKRDQVGSSVSGFLSAEKRQEAQSKNV